VPPLRRPRLPRITRITTAGCTGRLQIGDVEKGGRQPFLHNALPAWQELHLLPVADFPTGNAIDRRSYTVENDDRALCVPQNRLVVFVQLLAGFKVEIFAGGEWLLFLVKAIDRR
jgi:hypothetical protein